MAWKSEYRDVYETASGLINFCEAYAGCVGIDWNSVTWASYDLMEVAHRFHKAVHYYEVYHDEDLQESYEAAIFAHWILKIRVFRCEDEQFSTVNTKIAALLLYCTVAWATDGKAPCNPEFWNNLCYALHYRALGHEAIMHLTEALVV